MMEIAICPASHLSSFQPGTRVSLAAVLEKAKQQQKSTKEELAAKKRRYREDHKEEVTL